MLPKLHFCFFEGGFLLGGGFGYHSRHFGILSDNLLEIEYVNYKGDIIIGNSEMNEDLFWASRGSGGGQFGVVTSLTMQTYPVEDRVLHFQFRYHDEDLVPLMKWWQSAAPIAPIEIGSRIKKNEFSGYSFGTEEEFFNWLNTTNFYDEVPEAEFQNIETVGYLESLLIAGDLPRNDSHALLEDNLGNYYFKHVSAYAHDKLSNETIEELFANMKANPNCTTWIIIDAYGGAIDNLGVADTAFAHRQDVLFMMQLVLKWNGSMAYEDVQKCREWQRMTRNGLMKDMQGAYQNYVDSELENYMDDYYGVNADRLIDVKTKYDPENKFEFEQSIPRRQAFEINNTTSNSPKEKSLTFSLIIMCMGYLNCLI